MAGLHRRQFLKNTARTLASAGGITILAPVPGKAAANERVNIAVMGVRGRGRGLAPGFAAMKEAQVTCLVDVDANVLPPVAKNVAEKQGGNTPRLLKEIREALADRSVDALVVATPDHWHALATIWACQNGKHVYVEKPASHNIWEGRKMVEAARKYKCVVQVGTQSRSAANYLEAMEFLRSGKLGKLHMAKAWNSQLRANIGRAEDAAVPAGVDYGLWLGPAPERPFNPNRFHYSWHWNWDYGTGDMGNDGVHDLDIARWGLGVAFPSAASGYGGKLFFDDDQQTPDTQMITFEFPETKQILVYEQRLWSPYHQENFENGVAFYGTEGQMLIGRAGWKVILRKDKPGPVSTKGFSDDPHRQNFLDAIRSGKPLNADIEEGHRSATLAHLGNIVARVGRPVKFDPKTETIIGDGEAAHLVRRSYRRPFEVPEAV